MVTLGPADIGGGEGKGRLAHRSGLALQAVLKAGGDPAIAQGIERHGPRAGRLPVVFGETQDTQTAPVAWLGMGPIFPAHSRKRGAFQPATFWWAATSR